MATTGGAQQAFTRPPGKSCPVVVQPAVGCVGRTARSDPSASVAVPLPPPATPRGLSWSAHDVACWLLLLALLYGRRAAPSQLQRARQSDRLPEAVYMYGSARMPFMDSAPYAAAPQYLRPQQCEMVVGGLSEVSRPANCD